MDWQCWTGASLAGPAISQPRGKHSCRAELCNKRGIKTAIHLRNNFPSAAYALFAMLWSVFHTALTPTRVWLLLVPGLITSHFPTINCISHLSACNPDKSKSFWMSLFCSSVPYPPAPPTSSALFYVISIFKVLLKLHSAQGHCTEFNPPPPPIQHINALTPIWFIYIVYYQRPIQSIQARIQTHAHIWIMHTNTHQEI